jgi:hypothetical protein
MIFPEFDVPELIDAQILIRLWNLDNRPPMIDPLHIPLPTRCVIEVLDPETYQAMFP